MFDDRLAELDAFAGIAQGSFEGGAGDAQGLGGDADAAAFEVGQGNRQTLAALAEQIGRASCRERV